MGAFLEITFTKTGVIGIKKNQLREVGRLSIYATARYWWENFLPIHFTRAAYARYRYRKRGYRYSQRKRKRAKNGQGVKAIGEVRPLVWSGRSRKTALTEENIRARAKNYQVYVGRVVINAPTLNFVKGSRQELKATTAAEEKELEEIFGAEFEHNLRAVTKSNRVSIVYRS